MSARTDKHGPDDCAAAVGLVLFVVGMVGAVAYLLLRPLPHTVQHQELWCGPVAVALRATRACVWELGPFACAVARDGRLVLSALVWEVPVPPHDAIWPVAVHYDQFHDVAPLVWNATAKTLTLDLLAPWPTTLRLAAAHALPFICQ